MKATVILFGKKIKEIDLPDDYVETLPARLSAFIEEAKNLGCRVEIETDIALRKEATGKEEEKCSEQ